MPNEKKLIIGADVSGIDKSFKQVKKMLEGLQKEGIKVSNVLKDMTIEKNHGMGKFAKAITFSSQKMKDFRGITEDTAKVMKNVWQKTMHQEQQSLDRTGRQLEKLNKLRKEQMGYMNTARIGGGNVGQYQSNVDRLDVMIANKVAERLSRQDGLRELAPGSNRPWNSLGDGYRSAISGVGAAAGGAAQILGSYQSMKTLGTQNVAALHSYEKGLLGRMVGGDFSDLYFMGQGKKFGGAGANGNALKYGMDKAGGLNAAGWQGGLEFLSSGAGALGGIAQMLGPMGAGGGGGGAGALRTMDNSNFAQSPGAIASGVNGAYRAYKNNTEGGPNVAEAQAVQAQLGGMREQSPFSEAALNFISSTAGMRVAGSKALQGRHMGAWGIGSGFGLDMGESMAAGAQLGRMGGVDAAMGTKGRPGLLGGVLGMEATGVDRGTAGQMMTQMNFASGGDSTRAMKQMQEVMSKAFSVGLKDARLGEEIGRATAEASINGAGGRLTDSTAVGRSLTGGLGSNSTLFDVQQNIAGGQAFNARMNNNTYFNAVKMEAAKNVLGGGGSHTQMLALQKASWEDLVGGSRTLKVAGVDEKQRKSLLNDMARSGVSTYLDKSDPAMKDLSKVAGSNDFIGALQKAKRRKDGSFERIMEQYGTLMSTRTGVSQETAEGELRLLSGFGDKSKGSGNYSSKVDGTAVATVQAQQTVLHKLYEKEIKMREDYLNRLKNVDGMTDAIEENDDNKSLQAFEDLMKKFIQIVEQSLKQKHLPPQGAQRGR